MGLTIHFDGVLEGYPQTHDKLVAAAIAYADSCGWTWEEVASEQATRFLDPVEPQASSEPAARQRQRGGRPGWAGQVAAPPTGPLLGQEVEVSVRGVRLFPGERCEAVNLLFDNSGRMDDSCKSHPDDTSTIHLEVIDLLRAIEPLFERLHVHDEGGGWDR